MDRSRDRDVGNGNIDVFIDRLMDITDIYIYMYIYIYIYCKYICIYIYIYIVNRCAAR